MFTSPPLDSLTQRRNRGIYPKCDEDSWCPGMSSASFLRPLQPPASAPLFKGTEYINRFLHFEQKIPKMFLFYSKSKTLKLTWICDV